MAEEINKQSNNKSEKQALNNLDSAIEACELNIKRHSLLAATSMLIGFGIITMIVLSGGWYATNTSNSIDMQRLTLLEKNNNLKSKLDEYEQLLSAYEKDSDSYKKQIQVLKSQISENNESDSPEELAEEMENLVKSENYINSRIEVYQKIVSESLLEYSDAEKVLNNYSAPPLIPQEILLTLTATVIVIFSIFIALYRFHQKEMTKNEHYKLGFLRIRIAYNNFDKEGFGSEVRIALTENAFAFKPDGLFDKKSKQIESPVPGHPTSDIATALTNKLLEKFDIDIKPK